MPEAMNKDIDPKSQEVIDLFKHGAVFVNHFYAVPAGDFLRLTVAEKTFDGSVKVPRFSGLLSYTSVLELHSMLGEILARIQASRERQSQAANDKPKKEELN